MPPVSIEEAQAHLPELIEDVVAGHDVVIAATGELVARIVPIPKKREIRFGSMKGQVWIAEDFDDPLPAEIIAGFGIR